MLNHLMFSTLAPEELVQACGLMNASGQWVYPQWRDAPGGQKYYKSYNLAPSLHRLETDWHYFN